jgi:hypothetical protein
MASERKTKRGVPWLGEYLEMRANHVRLDERQSPDRHRRVLGQTLGTLGAEQNRNEPLDERRDPLCEFGI